MGIRRAVPSLIEIIKRGKVVVVKAAITAVVSLDPAAKGLAKLMIKKAKDKSPFVRMSVADALGTLTDKSVIPTLLRMAENTDNRFYVSPLARWWTKLVLWWRGYRFTDDELVERWLDSMFDGVSEVLPALVQLRGHMEIYLAALAFRDTCHAQGLEVCFPEIVEEGAPDIEALFNPLLMCPS